MTKYYVVLMVAFVLLSLGCVENNADPVILKIDTLADNYNAIADKHIEIGELYILAENDAELNSVIAKYNSISYEYESYLDECSDIKNEINILYMDGSITRDDYIFVDEYLNEFVLGFEGNAKSAKYMAIATEYYMSGDYDNHDKYYNLAEYHRR